MPDKDGYFGDYGGQIIPPELKLVMDEITAAYEAVRRTREFQDELRDLQMHYIGRPSPLFYGAHKINHCIGEALLAKYMGKKKVLAETGAGQHGVALATACALVGIPCEIHMGQVDIEKEHPNVTKMKILGCKLVPVTRGTATLKDAVDSAFEEYLKDPVGSIYAIGSVVGPHPFPMMVRDFQQVVGEEAREQFLEREGRLPTQVAACVGGGSNAMGAFTAFLDDEDVELVGVEPAGRGLDTPDHAATLTLGTPGALHGFKCYNLQDAQGNPLPVYSIASGLDYPGVGPQHCFLKDIHRVEYTTATDDECLDAFMTLSRMEGIIPALESAHAVAYAMRQAPNMGNDQTILVNLSGRGDKDADFVAARLEL
jgi:tryptophan synthase beta chain